MGQRTLKVDKIIPEGGVLHIEGQVTATSLQDVNGPWDPVNGTDIKFDDGNVGIGTDAPTYKLDVHGAANVGVLTTTSVSGDGSGLTNIQKANIPDLIQEQWTTLNDDILYFQNSNAGIGTSTPVYKLDVHGSANVGALNVTSISGDGSGLTNINGSAIVGLVNQWISDEDDLRYEDGNVGLGKGTPNHTLDVNGNVNATTMSLSDFDIPVYLRPNVNITLNAQWAKEIGGDTNFVRDVAIDSNGNVFVTGEYTSSGSVTVGSGVSLSATTEANVYLIKYNSSGVAEWAINMIGRGNTVAIDPSGNVYISGSYESPVNNVDVPSTDDNPLIGKLVQTTRGATFLIKYDNAGVAQWATRVDGTDFYNGDDIGRNLAIDSSGNLYLAGSYNGYFGFNAYSYAYSADGISPNIELPVANNNSAFLVKYESGGTPQWVKAINASGQTLGYGVAVDSGSNVFITGEYTANSDVNVGGSISLPTTTGVASFLVKYDTGGTTQWATKIDGSSTDKGVSVVTGKNGNVHILGIYRSDAVVVSPSITLPDTSGNDTTFLLTYDTQGVAQWATIIDGVGADVVTDSIDAIFVTGSYSSPNSNVSSTGGKDITLLTPSGSAAFLVEYSPNGILRSSTHIDGTSIESGNALAVDSLGQNVYVSGTTGSNSVIYNSDGTPSGLTLTSGPEFVVKYNISKPLKLNVSSNLEVGTTNLFVDTQTSRVGLGTREPDATLHVEGNVYASSNLEVGGANLFVDTEVSRVGVRTRVPGFDLDVNGDINFTGDFYKNGVVFTSIIGSTPWSTLDNNISYTAGSVSIGVVEPSATLHVEGNVYASSNLEVGQANLFVDTVSGRVGIGKTDPGSALDVVGDVYVSSNLEVSNINFTGSFNQNGTPFESSPWTTTGDDLSYTTGRVGVGTLSPNANLHVEGDVYMSSNLEVGGTTISTTVYDDVPSVSWATSIGGGSDDNGYGIATDSDGNVYVTGRYAGSVTLAPGTTLTSNSGSIDGFVAKYDTSGTVQWARSIGGSGSDYGFGIATDSDGNVYVTGSYTGTLTIGSTTLTSTGSSDVLVVKYNTSGTFQWARSIGGTGDYFFGFDYDSGNGIAADSNGNVYVTGSYRGGTTIGSTTLTSADSNNAFIVKYDTIGGVQWAKSISGSGSDNGYGIATDSAGNVYVTGDYMYSVTLAPGTTLTSTSGSMDGFVAKYDTSGTVQWARSTSGTQSETGYGIATDSDGNVYVVGNYASIATIGSTTFTSAGGTDVFVAKYNTSGTFQWAKSISGTNTVNGNGIATDSNGNVYVTGGYAGSITIGSTILNSAGSDDVFVARYDTSGTVQWALGISGVSPDYGEGIATDRGGNVYVTGAYRGGATFAPGTTLNSTSGSMDGFIVKYSPPNTLHINTGLEVGTANLYVDTVSGMVGIGTSTPEATLHVEGNVYASSNLEVGGANLFVDTQTSRVGLGTRTPDATLHVEGNVYASSNLEVGGANLFVDTQTSRVGLGTRTPDATLHVEGNVYASSNLEVGTANLFVDTVSGRVGIGKIDPGSALDVVGDVFVSSNLEVSNINFTGSFNQNGTPFESSPWTTTGDDLSYTTGRVGIGTLSPNANLHVEGDVYMSSNLEVGRTTISVPDDVPSASWARSIGGPLTDYGEGIATDSNGNVYVVGSYAGSVTIESLTLYATGSTDVFVAKYNTSGTFQWAKSIGGPLTDYGYSISVDSSGNVYVTGRYSDSITIESFTLYATGSSDAFVVKYNTDGIFQWARSIGGEGSAYGNGIATDSNGNVYVTGRYSDSITIGSTTLNSVGSADVFVAKYDTNGTVQWALGIGGTSFDTSEGIATDSNGNVYVTGIYFGSTTIGSITLNSTAGSYDAFVAKYDTDGIVQWARSIDVSNPDYGYGIAADSNGNVFVTGRYSGSITIGSTTLNSTGFEDAFVVKYDTNGTVQWARTIGGEGSESGYGIATDSNGDVYVLGLYSGSVTIGSTTLNSAGSSDAFVAKYNTSGTVQWALGIGGTSFDSGYGIATDSNGNVYVIGFYRVSVTIGTTILDSVDDSNDAFVAKYSPPPITLHINTNVDVQGDLNVSGTTTNVSDKRLKSNVQVIGNALEKVDKLSGYTFTMNDKRNAGVIAQEVLEVLPEVVGGSEETTYSVAYGNMAGLFIEAIKELKREIEVLKTGN